MATNLVAFFINNYMVVLIVLNIILVITVIFLALYLIKDKKDSDKKEVLVCENCDIDEDDNISNAKHKEKREPKSERVFVGRFITDEEYQQMSKNRRSDISILMEEVNKEYEHLKELSK